ncbi:MAG: cellobiose phosphorylase [Candidatus Omnitrophica bacterium]|nr:cellobiose phosphorylase [Candidatus Omnitrophota bacterium]
MLWQFKDNLGSFVSYHAHRIKTLYFPLTNTKIMSSITPYLAGDIKTAQDYFLLEPVTRIDLFNSKCTRNFWVYIDKDNIWSATGVSKNLVQLKEDNFRLEAGLLWHKIIRENKRMGLKAEILSFVPATDEELEIMYIRLTNIKRKNLSFISYVAIPIYARSADNIRDHRHVTSLLQRIKLHRFGIIFKPTLIFNEAGHRSNDRIYFVLSWDERFNPPLYFYPTHEIFCGEDTDLERPLSVYQDILPNKNVPIQGKEPMAGLRFARVTLKPGNSFSYTVIMGIVDKETRLKELVNKFNSLPKIDKAFRFNCDFWSSESKKVEVSLGDSLFDNWFRWVSIQPTLRRIFGNSFLPDFDYGRGGRGWRDLWQDCLSLILTQPKQIRSLLINNFSGIRIDGSNAAIIGKKPKEFISDRNNISRTWMDHGIWPLLTLDLYLNETADYKILFEEVDYFRDHQLFRAKFIDQDWSPQDGYRLKTISGKLYKGSILEHLLVEVLVQFFNVGPHNYIRLEDADWNDGLDMADEFGESVAFSCMYAYCLKILAKILRKIKRNKVRLAEELAILFNRLDYREIKAKHALLERYFTQTRKGLSGKKIDIDTLGLAKDLEDKSHWMIEHIRKKEWLKEGFFNGYYDNRARRVEGKKNGRIRMMLASQVFPILSEVAEDWQIKIMIKNIERYLWDKRLKGYHLNTDFKEEQPHLGRAFSFVYGDKENGAFFNHMIVMFAYALYKRGYVKEGYKALNSIYRMAVDTSKSKIYPCIPEYFNLEGRGMYSYLTGSASWFILTILTEVFGVKGKEGDLLIEPKLLGEQFKASSTISITRSFAERRLKVFFLNPKRLSWPQYKINQVYLNNKALSSKDDKSIMINRKDILRLSKEKINEIEIILGYGL